MAVGASVGVGGIDVACAVAVGLGGALAGVGVGVAPVAAVAAGAMGVSASGALTVGVAVGAAPGATLGVTLGAGWPDRGVRAPDGQSQVSARMATSARLTQKSVTPGSGLGSAPREVACGVSGAGSGAGSERLMRSSLRMSRARDETERDGMRRDATGCDSAARQARGETRQGQAACAPV